MADENENVVSTEDSNIDYINAINELKQTTVEKSKYDALKEENKKLLDSIINGTDANIKSPEEHKETIEELRKKTFLNDNQTNLEYISNILKLRSAIMEEGGDDPFVANSSQYSPTSADYERANRVATVFQEMVDVANGDPAVFRNEYERRVKEVNIKRR